MRNHSILLLYKRGGKTGGCPIVIFYTKLNQKYFSFIERKLNSLYVSPRVQR